MNVEKQKELEKLEAIEETLEKTKELVINSQRPFFIELIGTPKSGKTTLKRAIQKVFKVKGIPLITRRETAEYNPIPKDDKNYNFWMILELMKNVSEDLSNAKGKVVLYDRGIIDRIPWMKYDISQRKMREEDYRRIMEMYSSDYLKAYKPLTQVFFTSPELSVFRKGSEGRVVNTQSLTIYNSILSQELDTIRNIASETNVTVTDQYQGRIQEFIIDQMDEISRGLELEVNKEATKKRTAEERV